MVRRLIARKKWRLSVCENVSGLLVESQLLATMRYARLCPYKLLRLFEATFLTQAEEAPIRLLFIHLLRADPERNIQLLAAVAEAVEKW